MQPLAVEHSVIGFYGVRADEESMRAAYEAMIAWCSALDCEPDLMATSLDKGRLIDYRRSHSKLLKNGYSGISQFQIVCLAEGATNNLEGDNFQVVFDGKNCTFAVSARETVLPLVWSAFQEELLPLLRVLKSEYGIGLRRHERLGPTLYVSGTACVSFETADMLTEEESDEIGGWGQYAISKQVWRQGLLRDVYPWNFLTVAQWSAKVGKTTLQRWIEEKGERGSLSPITNDMMLWKVPEAAIPAVREALKEAGVLFDWHKFEEEEYGDVPSDLSAEEVLGMVFGNSAAEDLKVLKIDKSGPQPEVRELGKEEIKNIKKAGKKRKS